MDPILDRSKEKEELIVELILEETAHLPYDMRLRAIYQILVQLGEKLGTEMNLMNRANDNP